MDTGSQQSTSTRGAGGRCKPCRGNVSCEIFCRLSQILLSISSAPVASGVFHGKVTCLKRPLDSHVMHQAAQRLLGERDFSAFRAAGCQSTSAYRNVQAVSVVEWCGITVIDIRANAFLQHMVRNISGSLIEIGLGKQKEAWIGELLESKDRSRAGVTAPPDGLYLVEVGYDESALPGNKPRLPLLLAGYE